MNKTTLTRLLITTAIVLAAAVLGRALWRHYLDAPWTRDGRVRADVVRIAPDVGGLVAAVPVHDNQRVRRGEVLLVIDRARYQLALDQADADLAVAEARAAAATAGVNAARADASGRRSEYAMYQAQARRRRGLTAQGAISVESQQDTGAAARTAHARLAAADAAETQAAARAREAAAAVQQARVRQATARLNLERTAVRAPAAGYVTNLDVHPGDYATAGTPRVALVESGSFHLYAYFEETKLPQVRVGDPVAIRLMSGIRLRGHVASIARGIVDADNPPGENLLARVNPTFNWVRLAQRVPVRIAIDPDSMPKGLVLTAGMTATIDVQPAARR